MSSESTTKEFLVLEHTDKDLSKVYPCMKGPYGKKAAWQNVLSEIRQLPVEERGGAFVKCYKDVTENDISKAVPYDTYSSAEVLFCMDRYGLELPSHGFVNYDYAVFMSYAESSLLKEGLKEPWVYLQAAEELPARHPFEGDLFWMRYDENRRVIAEADSFVDILPSREDLIAHSVDISVGTRNAEHKVFTTGAELAYLLDFMNGQPQLNESWIERMYKEDAVDAFLSLHYGDYQAFLLAEGYVGRDDSRLESALFELNKSIRYSLVEPDLAGFNAKLKEHVLWSIGEVCLLMRQHGIPGEDSLVRRFCLAGRKLPTEIASDHIVEQLAFSHFEYPTNASLSSYHAAAVMNQDLLSMCQSEKLESLRLEKDFWSPLKDFIDNPDDRPKLPIPEGLWDDKLFQAEGLLAGLISEEELRDRIYPENRNIHSYWEKFRGYSAENGGSMINEHVVMVNPANIKFVQKDSISAHMAKQVLQEDWSVIPHIPKDVIERVEFSEEDIKNAWRRQVFGFRDGKEALKVFRLLPNSFRTESVQRWMNEVERVYMDKDRCTTFVEKAGIETSLKR